MKIKKFGFCPYRIQLDLENSGFQAGCKLRIGKESLCYTQDVRPLIQTKFSSNDYHCPLTKISIPREIYDEFYLLIEPVLMIQDEQSTGINMWPIVMGISESKYKTLTPKGKEMVALSQKVREELHEIVLNSL